ncbi:MAG: hypothetical protein KA533_07465 [Sphingobium sp.]|nr:hypothetical protein [Sphingobium sp.]MBP6112585.1 hypothetical protein [Sphingobium sp.]MBP8671621.1 hypothetical protein [Sphingobium sp.]MBP9158615.1 hypothetical protein [Sphingobium sp.]
MSAQVVPFPQQRAYPYGRAPAFDPSNPAHAEAWQLIHELGAKPNGFFTRPWASDPKAEEAAQ